MPRTARAGITCGMFRSRHLSRLLFALSLASVLLFAQWLQAQHGANLASHTSSHSCDWCLAHTPLTGALPVTAAVMASPSVSPFPVALRSVSVAGDSPSAYISRAPPHFFPV